MSVLKSNKNMLKNRLTPNEMMFMLKHFARKEDGAMTLFAVFMFLIMILVAGLGVDLMRNEMERKKYKIRLTVRFSPQQTLIKLWIQVPLSRITWIKLALANTCPKST
jgi:hypothetical protein